MFKGQFLYDSNLRNIRPVSLVKIKGPHQFKSIMYQLLKMYMHCIKYLRVQLLEVVNNKNVLSHLKFVRSLQNYRHSILSV